jgi:hypothetical protein
LQEYACGWLGSGAPLLSGPCIDRLGTNHLSIPHITDDGKTMMWVPPSPGDQRNRFIAFIDPAEGTSHDYSVLTIIDCSPRVKQRYPGFNYRYEIALIHRSNTDPLESFAETISELADFYEAELAIETNAGGAQLFNLLRDEHAYPWGFIYTKRDAKDSLGLIPSVEGMPGFRITNEVLKGKMCVALKTVLEADLLKLNSEFAFEELKRIESDGPKWVVFTGHDDIAATLRMAGFIMMSDWLEEEGARQRLVKNLAEHPYMTAVFKSDGSSADNLLAEYAKRGYLPGVSGDADFAREMNNPMSLDAVGKGRSEFSEAYSDHYPEEMTFGSLYGDNRQPRANRLTDGFIGKQELIEKLYGETGVISSDRPVSDEFKSKYQNQSRSYRYNNDPENIVDDGSWRRRLIDGVIERSVDRNSRVDRSIRR